MGTPNVCPPGSATRGQPCAYPSQCSLLGACRNSGPGAIHILLARDVVKQWPDIDQAYLVLYKHAQGVAAIQWSSARSAAAKMYLRACQALGVPSAPVAHEIAWPEDLTGNGQVYALYPDADPVTEAVQTWDVLAELRLYAERSKYSSWVIRRGLGGEVVESSGG